MIMFTPLSKEEISEIVELQFKSIAGMLEKHQVQIEITKEAIAHIARVGFDPHFGARPVKRAIQQEILTELSKKILAMEVDKSKPIVVDVDNNNNLNFRN